MCHFLINFLVVPALSTSLLGFLSYFGPHRSMISSSWSFVRADLRIFPGMFISASSRDRLVRLKSPLISICAWTDTMGSLFCFLGGLHRSGPIGPIKILAD